MWNSLLQQFHLSVIWDYVARKSLTTLMSWQLIHTTITDTSTVPLQFDFFSRVVCSNKRLTCKQPEAHVSPNKTPPKRQGMWEQGILCTFPGTVPFEAQTQQRKKKVDSVIKSSQVWEHLLVYRAKFSRSIHSPVRCQWWHLKQR